MATPLFSKRENAGLGRKMLFSVDPEVVDFGSGQGRSEFATAGVAALRRGLTGVRTPAWAKRCHLWMGTIYGWTLYYLNWSLVL